MRYSRVFVVLLLLLVVGFAVFLLVYRGQLVITSTPSVPSDISALETVAAADLTLTIAAFDLEEVEKNLTAISKEIEGQDKATLPLRGAEETVTVVSGVEDQLKDTPTSTSVPSRIATLRAEVSALETKAIESEKALDNFWKKRIATVEAIAALESELATKEVGLEKAKAELSDLEVTATALAIPTSVSPKVTPRLGAVKVAVFVSSNNDLDAGELYFDACPVAIYNGKPEEGGTKLFGGPVGTVYFPVGNQVQIVVSVPDYACWSGGKWFFVEGSGSRDIIVSVEETYVPFGVWHGSRHGGEDVPTDSVPPTPPTPTRPTPR